MLNRYFYVVIWVALILVDQVTKYIATLYGGIFSNFLFAFSAPVPVPLMYALYVIILGVIVWYITSRYRTFTGRDKWAWTLVAAGSISNIGERLVNGYVKDFIYLFSGVFNVADFYILLGILLLFIAHGRPSRQNI